MVPHALARREPTVMLPHAPTRVRRRAPEGERRIVAHGNFHRSHFLPRRQPDLYNAMGLSAFYQTTAAIPLRDHLVSSAVGQSEGQPMRSRASGHQGWRSLRCAPPWRISRGPPSQSPKIAQSQMGRKIQRRGQRGEGCLTFLAFASTLRRPAV